MSVTAVPTPVAGSGPPTAEDLDELWQLFRGGLLTDVRQWGDGVGTGGDDSTAIQETMEEALLVYLPTPPAGVYNAHELEWPATRPSLFGTEVGRSVIQYNGAGGPGSHVMGIGGASGAIPWSGFSQLTFAGYDGTVEGAVAENCIRKTGAVGLDWGFRADRLSFKYCFGDAVDFATDAPSNIVNLHMDRLRFDGVGGFPIALRGNPVAEHRPVTIRNVTMDNSFDGEFEARVLADGYYDGVRWGKGFLSVVDGVGLKIRVSDGRFEFQKRMIATPDGKTIFYMPQSIVGFTVELSLINLGGYVQPTDHVVAVREPRGGRIDLLDGGAYFANVRKFFEGVDLASDIVSPGGYIRTSAAAGHLGIAINTTTVESRAVWPDPTIQIWYKKGDTIFNRNPSLGSPFAWSCTAPEVGWGRPLATAITTAASCTAASAVVNITAPNRWFVGQNIRLTGAGVAGAALDARVIAVDDDANTITLDVAVSTSVNPLTIAPVEPTFLPVGLVGG